MAGFVGDNYNDYKVTNQFQQWLRCRQFRAGQIGGQPQRSRDGFGGLQWRRLAGYHLFPFRFNRNRLGSLTARTL